jgi:condensin complex subunit 1
MLVLIWSKEKSIREELVKAYWTLFFNDSLYDSKTVARTLINLQNQSTLTETTSLEELLNYIMDWNNQIEEKDKEKKRNMYYINDSVIRSLWDLFLNSINGVTDKNRLDARSALQILRIISSKKKESLSSKMEVLEGILESFRKNKVIIPIYMKAAIVLKIYFFFFVCLNFHRTQIG